jgi:hypothetical protein
MVCKPTVNEGSFVMNRLELMRNASAFVFLASVLGLKGGTAAANADLCMTSPIFCGGGSWEGCEINCEAQAMQSCPARCIVECSSDWSDEWDWVSGCEDVGGGSWEGAVQCICS